MPIRLFALAALLFLTLIPGVEAQSFRGHVPKAISSSKSLGALSRSDRMNLAVGLPLRNQGELEELLKQLADPGSSNFRHYLTPEQFTERFGPSEQDYQTLAGFLRAHGLEVRETHPNRMILDVSGTVAAVERTFHVNMLRWQHATRGTFFAPDREPSVDAGVAILDVSGLDNFTLPRPMDLKALPLSEARPFTTGSGPVGLFIGRDFRAAYAPGVMLNGSGQSVGLFELDGFYASDVQANFKQASLPPVPVQTVLLNNFNGAPGDGNMEVTLDIMMAAYMAPGLSKIIVYEGLIPNDVLNRMATDNLAAQLSSSWCFSPTNATTEQIFQQMIAQGQSLFQASGDDGAYRGWIMPPADDPYVTVVGGTSLTTTGAGGAWQSESVWPGSGGGISTVWPIPGYQDPDIMVAAGGSSTMRNVPDVALTADVQMYLIQDNGKPVMAGGTSAAAPLWAGFLALANQQAAGQGKPPIGFLNPPIYGIGSGSRLQTDLHDIASGGNQGFGALPGYDLSTGWGTPAGQGLIDDLTGVSNPAAFSISLSAPGMSIAAGASGSTAIHIAAQNGFSGAVSLAVSGLPAGVTGSFEPAAAVTAGTLTLTAGSTAAPATSTLTITGVSGTLSTSARLTLTVAEGPVFTLAAAPLTIGVTQGGSATGTVTVTRQHGFSGTVNLAASGLPPGVTATFNPANTTATSTLTLTASNAAPVGTSTVTVTGSSTVLRTTATFQLAVAANYTIAASPASLSIAPGASQTTNIRVVPQNGFNSAVAFSIDGLPAGVSAAFSPASTKSGSTLTFTAAAGAVPGVSVVTITGVAGATSSKTTITVTVPAVPGFALIATPGIIRLDRGSSSAGSIAVIAKNGFNDAVSLTVSNLPAGVTATLSTGTTRTSSNLTLRATGAATVGTSTVVIAGTSGKLSGRAGISLTITAAPGFSLSATPASLSLTQGTSGTSIIGIAARNGFKDPVALAFSGLPSGVTATFAPPNASGNSVAIFTADATAATGPATVTITGVSGILTGSTTVTLTVVPPPFVVSVSPAVLSIPVGSAGSSSVTVTLRPGFTGPVTVSVSGMPGGVVSMLGASSQTGTRVLGLLVTSAAAPGTATLTVTARSGSQIQTATLDLTLHP